MSSNKRLESASILLSGCFSLFCLYSRKHHEGSLPDLRDLKKLDITHKDDAESQRVSDKPFFDPHPSDTRARQRIMFQWRLIMVAKFLAAGCTVPASELGSAASLLLYGHKSEIRFLQTQISFHKEDI